MEVCVIIVGIILKVRIVSGVSCIIFGIGVWEFLFRRFVFFVSVIWMG